MRTALSTAAVVAAFLALPAAAEITPTVQATKPIFKNLPPAPATVTPKITVPIMPSGHYTLTLSYGCHPIGQPEVTTVVVTSHNGGAAFTVPVEGVTLAADTDTGTNASTLYYLANPQRYMIAGGRRISPTEIKGEIDGPCTIFGPPNGPESDFDLVYVGP